MRGLVRKAISSPELGLVLIIAALAVTLTLLADSHVDRRTGELINRFWNTNTLIQTATDASFFAIMAVGAAIVIISGGSIFRSGSIYALAGVSVAMLLRADRADGRGATVAGRAGASRRGSGCSAGW
jgi:ribose/xylose/arabinose/galactoside ABC-type transport system permease subunit